MKITKKQLRRIILEVVGSRLSAGSSMTSDEDYDNLVAGDKLTLNGKDIVVVSVDTFNAIVSYVEEGKSTLKDFDYRYATLLPEDPPDMIPELVVVYQGPGTAPKNTRRAPRKKGAGRSYSYYD